MAMADIKHPYQCIETVEIPASEGLAAQAYALAACGPKLVSLDTNRGEIVSQWTADSSLGVSEVAVSTKDHESDSHERPSKKQKVQPAAGSLPNIIKLTITPDNRHAVVVTDDKYLRVFEITHDGDITELSQRVMPKRPCAIQVLPDNATILCGDKFGDVYSLPLLQQEPEPLQQSSNGAEQLKQQPSSFKPSASNRTVHTKRNLKSLEAQLKQKNLTPKTKEPLKFEHKLLLGHVSMLTDLCYATQEVNGKQQGYIVTADRDEHIRVSRGPPQTHIIEGYCLGHTEFVSKVLVIPESNLMISGGGDDWLGVWEWPSFKLRRKIYNFMERVQEAELSSSSPAQNPHPCPVSGMWVVQGKVDERHEGIVAVACERSSIVSWFPVSELLKPNNEPDLSWATSRMDAPVMDITQVGPAVLVSRHESDPERQRTLTIRVEALKGAFKTVRTDSEPEMKKIIQALEKVNSTVASEQMLNEFLYTVESLRKRTYKDREDEDGEE
jgi:tRNA (guanine-N(7)-)-methyltransferase subunit TRM82